jgi:hypothetical protein
MALKQYSTGNNVIIYNNVLDETIETGESDLLGSMGIALCVPAAEYLCEDGRRQQPGIRMVGSAGRMAIVRHLSGPVSDP